LRSVLSVLSGLDGDQAHMSCGAAIIDRCDLLETRVLIRAKQARREGDCFVRIGKAVRCWNERKTLSVNQQASSLRSVTTKRTLQPAHM